MKLRDRFIGVAQRRRLAANTVDCYWRWIEEFLRFCAVVPIQLERDPIEAFIQITAPGGVASATLLGGAGDADRVAEATLPAGTVPGSPKGSGCAGKAGEVQ